MENKFACTFLYKHGRNLLMTYLVAIIQTGGEMQTYRRIKLSLIICILLLTFVQIGQGQPNFWEPINGLSKDVIDVSLNSRGDIFIVEGGQGVFRSIDNGQSWKPIGTFHLPGGRLSMNRTGSLFYSSMGKGFRSLDYGENWDTINVPYSSILDFIVGENRDVLAIIPITSIDGPETRLLRSTDNGETWTHIFDYTDHALINKNGVIFVSTGLRVYHSTNNGISWTNSVLPGHISDLIIDSYNHLFAGMSALSTLGGGIFKSLDTGATWQCIDGSPPISSFKINDNNQMVVSGIEGINPSIFVSGDDGQSWKKVDKGLPNREFAGGFAIDSIGRVLVGTDSGVFRSVEPTVGIKQLEYFLPSVVVLEQNYPNPFNPSTSISFNLPSKAFVSLKVFDLIGREVANIVSEEMSAGKYSRQWNATRMSNGIYFYRLHTGSYTETKKLVLLK